jgi:hypothetical protein
MTQGGAARRICIRLSSDQAQDLKALQSWLSLEEWFTEAQAEHGLKVVYRERDGTEQAAGPDGPPMGGVVTEIVLMVAAGALTPVMEDIYEHVKTSVHAFATNLSSRRRRIEGRVTVEDAPEDDAGGGARDTDDGPARPSGRQDGEGGRIG